MKFCVIDGRGGGLGSQLVAGLRGLDADGHEVIGLGTNQAAAMAMCRAGATRVAAGEEAITRAVRDVDLILGSLSIVLPGSMLGEVTPALATAVLEAPGRKLLLPLNRRQVEVVGAEGRTLDALILRAIQRVHFVLESSVLT